MRAAILMTLLAVVPSLSAAPKTHSVRFRWNPPACTEVRGLPNLFISTDRGRTFSGNPAPPPAGTSTALLAVSYVRNLVVAAAGKSIYESFDSGCTWSIRYTVTSAFRSPLQVMTGRNGRVWFWTEDIVVGYDRIAGVVERPTPEAFVGFGVDPRNGDRIRGIGTSGQGLWDSGDAGIGWRRIGSPLGTAIIAGAFDPFDVDHVIVATASGSLMFSRDGGATWSVVPDFSAGANVCDVVFSPSDPSIVWLLARRGADFIYRSTDGGAHFEAVRLSSGIGQLCFKLTPHPTDGNVVALAAAGNLFLIDAAARSITASSCCLGSIQAATFSPGNENVIYVFAGSR